MKKPVKPYRKRSRVGKVGPETEVGYAGPELPIRGAGLRKLNTAPPEMQRLVRRIGRRLADAVWEVQQKVTATAPEAIAYHWLESWHYRFDFQSSQLGGLWVRGGAVVDFVIYDMSHEGCYIWRVQGEHWHQSKAKQNTDRLQKDRLAHLMIGGMPVAAVVDLWEFDLYDRYPYVLEMARMGEQIRYD